MTKKIPMVSPAFQEHSAIRNAYICVFLLASLKGATHAAVQMHLEGVAIGLRSAMAQSPDVEFAGLDTMARTNDSVSQPINL